MRDNRETIKELLDRIVNEVDMVPRRDYWMVRTDRGRNYDPFLQHGIVALRMPYVSTAFASQLVHANMGEVETMSRIKTHFSDLINNPANANQPLLKEIDDPSTLSKRASQLYSFCLKMNSGDIVLIPSSDSSYISMGVVDGDEMLVNDKLNEDYPIARKVKWINQISKTRLEPGLYRAIGNHQAMTNISKYAESLERNYGSCFLMDDVCHYVITFNSEQISADKFFGLGQTLLQTLQKLSNKYDLQIDVRDINLTMNLNSPGRIDFKSNILIAVLMMAILSSCSGGDMTYDNVLHGAKESFTELVQKVYDFFGADGENAQMCHAISDYLNGMDAQAVEKFNQNSMNVIDRE